MPLIGNPLFEYAILKGYRHCRQPLEKNIRPIVTPAVPLQPLAVGLWPLIFWLRC